MRIHDLYTDASGQSHFRDIEVEWVEERRGSKLSKRLPATGIIFRETQAEHDIDWHPAPRRQYIINLEWSTASTTARASRTSGWTSKWLAICAALIRVQQVDRRPGLSRCRPAPRPAMCHRPRAAEPNTPAERQPWTACCRFAIRS
jgi:hypothetical protein